MSFVCVLIATAQLAPISPAPITNAIRQQILLDVQSNMIKVTADSFEMGEKNDGDADSKPVHKVWVNGFMISKYDVTQALWKAVMGNNPSGSTKCDSCPVEKVSWNDAQEFIKKLNTLTGKHYRLPFEAEWEYAARGGNQSKGYNFSGSDEIDSVGWNDNNSENGSHPVAQKHANELGLYDMTGNVLQWCNDWYNSDYYLTSPGQNPKGPGTGKTKVLRGCAWNIYTSHCGVAVRADLVPDSRTYNVGFRLVQDL